MQRIVLGLLLIFTILSARAADEGLTIGSARLTIGMDKANVWNLLKRYSVQCLGSEKTAQPPTCNSWIVTTEKLDRFIPLGNSYFVDGRLKNIYKYYDSAEWWEKPEKFVSLLYEVLRQYSTNGHEFVTSIGEIRQPEGISKSIFFRSGKRLVVVNYSEGSAFKGVAPVSLQEELE